ncbi:MAG: sulfatase-like hydrolase/transferase [Chthoniobacter sp.]|nr:sulfatase-like hydrolase/transferase [Chthoniobacter sp.]
MNPHRLIKAIHLLLAALLLPAWFASAADSLKGTRKPNIIFILADDVGLGETSYTGADKFKTPNIDALAKTGTIFDTCYSMPLCGPSRCTLLTGRYPFRTGLNTNHSAKAIEPGKEIMIPTVLKKAGYVTAAAGKWGQMNLGPAEWGFDESVSARNGQYRGTSYVLNGKNTRMPEDKYMPDLMHEFVADFMNRHKDQPFFIYYPLIHVHIPILPTPDSKPDADKDQLYADNIAYMDKLVAKLMAELDRLKLRDNTLVVFAGDNGSIRSPGYTPVKGRLLSGHKASLTEGGSRVPMFVTWPGTTPAGTVNHDLVDFTDFFTTFAELADAPLPPGVAIDGRSFLPQIKGEKGKPREWVYVELDGKSYACDRHWKLTNTGEFLDLEDAPFVEKAVPADTTDPKAIAARTRLQAVLTEHPAAPGDGTTRGGGKRPAKAKAGEED